MTDTLQAEGGIAATEPSPKLCSSCHVKPRRTPKQGWCNDCHADYVRFRRQADGERAVVASGEANYTVREDFGVFSGIYFLWCDGFIKIGQSCNVVARWRAIQSANPHTVVPIGYVNERNIKKLSRLELGLHLMFKKARHRGEWFVPCPELFECLAQHSVPWPWEVY